MIKFALRCASGHDFESWFRTSAAYEAQVGSDLVLCPVCQTSSVAKAIMAPAVSRHEKPAPALATAAAGPAADVALIDSRDRELRAMIEGVRKRILEHTDDVGPHFAEEARKIHDGLVPGRAIHGQATAEEARALIEEGIGILPIPRLPGDLN